MPRIAALVSVVCILSGCIAELLRRTGGFDARPLTIQSFSLFNQRLISRQSKKSWKGDWIFRRDRLELIDQVLRNIKPDVLVMQEVIEKTGSAAESDVNILSAGALSDYDWRQASVEQYADTKEAEALAVAVGPTLKFQDNIDPKRETWMLGTGGYLMASTVDYEDQPVTVFDVQMPPAVDNKYFWYSFVQERIVEKVKRDRRCAKRVIVAGFLPGDETAPRIAEFTRALRLKDSAAGFCQIAAKCFTATPANELYIATLGDETPSRTDKIFVHQSAYVYTSSRVFADADPSNHYARDFGLTRLWATQRFGWVAQVRLPRCTEAELEEGL